jgi:DNA-directed RNA polymerase subunit RPC12/RpoP
MDEITDLKEAIRCRCGQIYHDNCAAKVVTCPTCGNDLDVGDEEEKKMTTAKCSSCSEIVLIEEDADLMRTMCENCGSALKVVETGYNHLVVDDTPTVAYNQFNSLMKKNLTGLIISTTYPEKLKKEITIENVELYWLTDTSSEFQTLDPKRLDFEIMRAISNFVKKSEGGVIILDGLEYLAVENGFEVSLKFIKKVNDLCSINDATLVVPITPLSLAQDQLSMLKKEFDRVEDLTGR